VKHPINSRRIKKLVENGACGCLAVHGFLGWRYNIAFMAASPPPIFKHDFSNSITANPYSYLTFHIFVYILFS
jgi:hypothetical protein